MRGSFLELDGSTDGTVKSIEDVYHVCKEMGLPKPTYVIQTSRGRFHLLWTYNNPLPWNESNQSYWLSQQRRFIEAFRRYGFLVDEKASLNPVQNLRNPSQLNPYNFKRRCEVIIEKNYTKTSLRNIYRAFNQTYISNPRKESTRLKIRKLARANKFFSYTYDEWAKVLGVSRRTAVTHVKEAIVQGVLSKPTFTGNNKGQTRQTKYTSLIFIEPFSGVQESISKTIFTANEELIQRFNEFGVEEGFRNNAIFACGMYLKWKKGGNITFDELYSELYGGCYKSGLSENEFTRTIKNILKPRYSYPLSQKKLSEWSLISNTKAQKMTCHFQ